MLVGFLSFLADTKRWFNGDTLRALSIAIVAIVCLAGFVLLFKAGGAATEAKVNWKWLQQISELNRKRAERVAKINQAVADAATAERDTALATLKETLESKAELEAQLAKIKDNPVIYTRDERRRLFK